MLLPRVIGSLDVQELNQRLRERSHRLTGGRSNEFLFHYIEDTFTTHYTEFIEKNYDSTAYRYVMLCCHFGEEM